MKIPSERHEFPGFTNEAGETLWISTPRTVKEGVLNRMGKKTPEGDGGRTSNLMLLDLATSWNLDDDDGALLPLTRTLRLESFHDQTEADRPEGDSTWQPRSAEQQLRDAKIAVLEQVPSEVLTTLARKVLTRGANVTERAEGF